MKEIIYKCDICNEELNSVYFYLRMKGNWSYICRHRIDYKELCEDCAEKIFKAVKKIVENGKKIKNS